jgi:hypothetical protein
VTFINFICANITAKQEVERENIESGSCLKLDHVQKTHWRTCENILSPFISISSLIVLTAQGAACY